MAEQLQIILVPHTHWDREWYQTFQQFRIRLVRTIDRLLHILDHDEKFSYFMLDGQTIVLDDYLEVQPQQEERLARSIRTGRILVGPWYLQPDEFLVSGESLIRNLQIGLRRASQYGQPMRVGYVPDCFGHIAQLPQILQGVGIDSAVFWRGVGAEAHKSEFFWAAPDGTRVLVIHLADPLGYSNARQMPLNPDEFVMRVELLVANILPKATTNTLLFMNGSDHLEPQEGLPEVIEAANHRLAHIDPRHKRILTHLEDTQATSPDSYESIHMQIGTLPQYIERVRQQHEEALAQGSAEPWKIVEGEMRSSQFAHLLPSVLSTRMWIKQQNTATEHLLERWVEPLTAWATVLGDTYPQGLVSLAWRYLLQNHPHDSICGCSIDQVHRENSVRFAQSQQIGESVVQQAMQYIASKVDTRAPFPTTHPSNEPVPIIVFNPAPGPRTECVQVVVQLPGSLHHAAIVDAQGRHILYRVVNRWRQERGSMPMPREMLAAAAALAEVNTPGELIQLARSMMSSVTGLSDDEYDLTRIYIEDYTESPIHHEPHIPQPGVVYIEVMIAPRGRIIVNEQEILAAGQQLLDLLHREDIHTMEVSLVDQARETIDFLATDLPAYGVKTFWLYPRGLSNGASSGHEPAARQLQAEQHAIENEFYRVEINTQNGTFTVTDKQTGATFADLHRFIDGGDIGDLYNYCPPEHDTLVSEPAELPKIELVNAGPLRATLRVSGRWALPSACTVSRTERSVRVTTCPIVSDITLTAGVQRIDIHTWVENKVKDHRLRVLFPVPFIAEQAAAEGTFEVRTRPVRHPRPANVAEWVEEPVSTFPQKRFVDVSNGTIGLAVLNRGLPEYEVVQESPGIAEGQMGIAITLLRCVEWLSRGDLTTRRGHAGPMEHTPEAQCLGRHEFDYAIVPHHGFWQDQEALVLREALTFNTPITTRTIKDELHEGQLPAQASLVTIEPPEIVVSAIKWHMEGQGLVVRLYNPLKQSVRTQIRLGVAFKQAYMANLLEEVAGPISVTEGADNTTTTSVELRGGEIMTVLFLQSVFI
jgi:alpha-mannosidase